MQTDQVSELLADVADRLILPRFGALKSSDIQEKKPGDLVTVADREAEIELDADDRVPNKDLIVRWKVAGDAPCRSLTG